MIATPAGTVVDGVQRFPTNDIKVVVIGAGIGGLQAALECWRKGCEVVILERADKLSPIGRPDRCHRRTHTARTNTATLQVTTLQ